jgi:hypothetical protein
MSLIMFLTRMRGHPFDLATIFQVKQHAVGPVNATLLIIAASWGIYSMVLRFLNGFITLKFVKR